MKKIFTFLTALVISSVFFAQIPQQFSYQAIVRGANNTLLSNQKVGIKISLLKGTENGQSVYSEVHTATTNANGLVSIAVGGGTFLEGNFIKIDWANGPYFIKTEIDPEGGTNYSLVTTTQLLSVPYALYAANSQPGPKGDKGEKGDQGTPGKDGLNGKDGKVEFQNLRVSATGDTLFLTNGNFVIIPGLSAANKTNRCDLQNIINSSIKYGELIDIDGNSYKTITAANKTWMAENLKVSKYSDGSIINNIVSNQEWIIQNEGACSSVSNKTSNDCTYGKLYNWYAVTDKRNVCPTGWHVATSNDFDELVNYVSKISPNNIGGALKSSGSIYWINNENATNIIGFNAVPSGVRTNRDGGGYFHAIGENFWMILNNNGNYQFVNLLNSGDRSNTVNSPNLFGYYNYFNENAGVSIRCVKD